MVKRARKHDKAAFQKLMEEEGTSMYKVARAILKNDEDVAVPQDAQPIPLTQNYSNKRMLILRLLLLSYLHHYISL